MSGKYNIPFTFKNGENVSDYPKSAVSGARLEGLIIPTDLKGLTTITFQVSNDDENFVDFVSIDGTPYTIDLTTINGKGISILEKFLSYIPFSCVRLKSSSNVSGDVVIYSTWLRYD